MRECMALMSLSIYEEEGACLLYYKKVCDDREGVKPVRTRSNGDGRVEQFCG